MNEVDFERKRNTVILKMFFKYDFKSLPLLFPLKITFVFQKKKIGQKSRCYKLVSKPDCEGSKHDCRV